MNDLFFKLKQLYETNSIFKTLVQVFSVFAGAAVVCGVLYLIWPSSNSQVSLRAANDALTEMNDTSSAAPHNYMEYRNGLYYYEADNSGSGATPVVAYFYRGIVNGKYVLMAADEQTAVVCEIPCTVMKIEQAGYYAPALYKFDNSTVAGAALQDAVNGQLTVTPPTPSVADVYDANRNFSNYSSSSPVASSASLESDSSSEGAEEQQ